MAAKKQTPTCHQPKVKQVSQKVRLCFCIFQCQRRNNLLSNVYLYIMLVYIQTILTTTLIFADANLCYVCEQGGKFRTTGARENLRKKHWYIMKNWCHGCSCQTTFYGGAAATNCMDFRGRRVLKKFTDLRIFQATLCASLCAIRGSSAVTGMAACNSDRLRAAMNCEPSETPTHMLCMLSTKSTVLWSLDLRREFSNSGMRCLTIPALSKSCMTESGPSLPTNLPRKLQSDVVEDRWIDFRSEYSILRRKKIFTILQGRVKNEKCKKNKTINDEWW